MLADDLGRHWKGRASAPVELADRLIEVARVRLCSRPVVRVVPA